MAMGAHADTTLWGGRPMLGLSYSQTPTDTSTPSRKVWVLAPGLSFAKAPIHRAELLIETEQNAQDNPSLTQDTTVSRVAIRVRKDVLLSPDQSVRLRAQVGHASGLGSRYFYGESDGALRHQLGALGLISGVTARRALDGTRGHDRHTWYLGGVLLLESHHELELRWQRSWDAYRFTKDTDFYSLEYTYQF